MISQERLKIEVKLLLSDNRKSCTPRRLAQWITLSDLERPFDASRAISVVAELLPVMRYSDTRETYEVGYMGEGMCRDAVSDVRESLIGFDGVRSLDATAAAGERRVTSLI